MSITAYQGVCPTCRHDHSEPVTALASGSGDHAGLRRLADEAADFGVPAQVDPAVLNALLAESEALRNDLAKTKRDFSELRDSYDRVSNKLCVERAHGGRETKRATEAERKLAEAEARLEHWEPKPFCPPSVSSGISKEAESG